MMRNACGSNDHPDPKLFGQVFRLCCCYSLVKPPRGSNVSGPELLKTLMQTKESLNKMEAPRKEWLHRIAEAINNESVGDISDLATNEDINSLALDDHPYDVAKTSEEVVAYMAGYVIRKIINSGKRCVNKKPCQQCIHSLQCHDENEKKANHYRLISLITKFDGLLYPSNKLYLLLSLLEKVVLEVVGKHGMTFDMFNVVMTNIEQIEGLPLVGCYQHQSELTKKIIDLFLVMRGHFLASAYNTKNNENSKQTKMYRKRAKL